MNKIIKPFSLAIGAILLMMGQGYASLPPLIPRNVIFGNPAQAAAHISPDGKWYTYLAPSSQGVMNIWLQDIKKREPAQMLTQDQHRGIRSYFWAKDNQHILYLQDKDGDENWHLYSITLASRQVQDLTPFDKVRVQGIMLERAYPQEILAGLNQRDPSVFDVYRINLADGTIKLDTKNPGDVEDWLADHHLQVRAALVSHSQDGSTSLMVRDTVQEPWRELIHWPFGEHGEAVGFSPDERSLYIISTLGSNTSRLIEVDFKTGKIIKVLAANVKSDLQDVLIDPITHQIEAVSFEYLKPFWQVFNAHIAKDFARIKRIQRGSFDIISRDYANQSWIVVFSSDKEPARYYVYHRQTGKAEYLFTARPELQRYPLASMQPIVIHARDGMPMVAYLTLPAGVLPKKLPLILHVHGGPWVRDSWGFHPEIQWLANRGYAVLQLNYRGSSGFGKRHLNAGNGQWGRGAMQHDLTDAVAWAVKQGIADPDRIAIYGGSYGGYAALAGVTFTPDLYACGVDIVGPSDLKTMIATIPPYWKTGKKQMLLRVGDVEKDARLNQYLSPLYHVENIRVPLLIAQGANDPRVKQQHADSMVKALRQRNLPVDYIVYTDEGHGFARPENRLDFYGRAEEFLAKYLGGRAEPWQAVKGSTASVR